MKIFLALFNIITTLRPLLRDTVLPAIRAVNIIKRVAREGGGPDRLRHELGSYLRNYKQIDVAAAAVLNAIKAMEPAHPCLKDSDTMNGIACYISEVAERRKPLQRMVWREIARTLIRYRNPERTWVDSQLDTALQLGYEIVKNSSHDD